MCLPLDETGKEEGMITRGVGVGGSGALMRREQIRKKIGARRKWTAALN